MTNSLFSNVPFSDVKFFDAGDYLCNATNKFGWQSASGSLVVKEHTRITAGPQDYEVEAGDTATFRLEGHNRLTIHCRISESPTETT